MEFLQGLVSKTSKKLKRSKYRLNSSLLLFASGLIIFTFGAVNYYRIRVLSFTKTPNISESQKGEVPVDIKIPSIGIDLGMDTGEIKDGVWQISYNKPTFLNSSARPGEEGNIVIYGHNKKAIFGNLPYLSLGQKIIVKTQDGKTHTYEAYRKDFVAPDRVDLVSPTNTEELTIYTCWGFFDQERVVIKAKPVR